MDNAQLSMLYMGSYIITLIASGAFLLIWRIFQRPLSPQQKSVTYLSIFATAWTAVEFISVFFYFGSVLTLFLNRLSMALAILMTSRLLDFALHYRGEIKRKTTYKVAQITIVVVAILALITNLSIGEVGISPEGFPVPVAGSLSTVFLAIIFTTLLASVYIFFTIWRDKKRTPLVRRSSLILLFASLIPGIIGLVTNIIFPLFSIDILPIAHIFSLFTQLSYIYVVATGGLGIRIQDISIIGKIYYMINLAITVTLFFGFFMFYTLSSQNIEDAINTQMENHNEVKSGLVDGEVEEIITDLKLLSQTPLLVDFATDAEMQSLDSEIVLDIEKLLGDFKNLKDLYDIFLVDLDGEIWWSQAKEIDYKTNLITGEYAQTLLGDAFRSSTSLFKFSLTDYKHYEPSRDHAAFVTMPITKNGAMHGVLAVQLKKEQFEDIISKESRITYETKALLFDETGYQIGEEIQVGAIPAQAIDECKDYTVPRKINFISLDEEKSIGYLSKSPLTGWCLLSSAKYVDAYEPQNNLLHSFALVSIILSTVTAILAHKLGEAISAPIKELQEKVTITGEARFEKKVAMDRKDEVGQLSLIFDQMTQRLKQSRLEIHRKVAEQTRAISAQSRKLENQQIAIMNILEDVETEKDLDSQKKDK